MTTPPSFTATNPPAVNFNAGPQTVTGFATFTPGLNGGTTPTYTVSNVSNPGLFSVLPAVAADGTLTYTPVAGGFGSSTFAVSVSDGTNSSATQTFTISVDPVMGVSPTTLPGTTIDLNSASWVTIPTLVPASNSAGIPAGTVADGTRILDVSVGSGATVMRGDMVTVAYKGYLLNGTIFDQSVSAPFTADELSLIPGFAAGLIGMKVGGTRDIDISSYLAYGGTARSGIPANSRPGLRGDRHLDTVSDPDVPAVTGPAPELHTPPRTALRPRGIFREPRAPARRPRRRRVPRVPRAATAVRLPRQARPHHRRVARAGAGDGPPVRRRRRPPVHL